MGVVLSAVDSLSWLGKIAGQSAPNLTALLPSRIDRPSCVLFLPYLCGERTPHNYPYPAGTFTNLSMNAELADMVQAILESVGHAFADCRRALARAGTDVTEAFVVGGGTRSSQWLQILANTTGIKLLAPAVGDFGAAFGAAKLGMAYLNGTPLEKFVTAPRIDRIIYPEPELEQAYADQQGNFFCLFDSIRGHITSWNEPGTSALR